MCCADELQITGPAGQLLSAITTAPLALSCFDRIQAFLVNPIRIDARQITNEANRSRRQSLTGYPGNFELQEMRNGGFSSYSTNAITFERVDVRPASEAALAIKEITFVILHATITMIVGPVGSGKTTLVKSMLGELPLERGQISVASSSLSYAAQRPWLQNGTIRTAVTGVHNDHVDEVWYREVLYACTLDQDIRQMEDGDKTVISSRGNALSGGQKQRLVRSFDSFESIA